MKICITSKGIEFDSELDTRFGRCQYFIIYDTKTNEYTAVENSGFKTVHGAGITAAQQLEDSGVEALITGELGPNSLKILTKAKIKGYKATDPLNIKDNIKLFQQGKLKEINKPKNSL